MSVATWRTAWQGILESQRPSVSEATISRTLQYSVLVCVLYNNKVTRYRGFHIVTVESNFFFFFVVESTFENVCLGQNGAPAVQHAIYHNEDKLQERQQHPPEGLPVDDVS
jgi:hypothetical protein